MPVGLERFSKAVGFRGRHEFPQVPGSHVTLIRQRAVIGQSIFWSQGTSERVLQYWKNFKFELTRG